MLKVVAPADPDYVSTCARLCDRGADLPREIEERARTELGMIRTDEVFYQVVVPGAPARSR